MHEHFNKLHNDETAKERLTSDLGRALGVRRESPSVYPDRLSVHPAEIFPHLSIKKPFKSAFGENPWG